MTFECHKYSEHSGIIRRLELDQKGASLLELLIYIAVFAILAAFLASIFPVLLRSRATANARFDTEENLRFAVEKIQQTVLDMNFLETAGTCPTNTLDAGTGLATTTFQVSGGVLQIREGVANPFNNVTASNVTVASFNASTCLFTKVSNLAPAKPAVQVKIKVSYNDGGRPELIFSDSAQFTVSPR